MGSSNAQIIVDVHEQRSGIPEMLVSLGTNTIVKTLNVGDYVINSKITIERKDIKDFVSSVRDKRLFIQCEKLKSYPHPIIIIEGDVSLLTRFTEDPMIFYNAIAKVALIFKIPIIPTASPTHTAKLLSCMCLMHDVL